MKVQFPGSLHIGDGRFTGSHDVFAILLSEAFNPLTESERFH